LQIPISKADHPLDHFLGCDHLAIQSQRFSPANILVGRENWPRFIEWDLLFPSERRRQKGWRTPAVPSDFKSLAGSCNMKL